MSTAEILALLFRWLHILAAATALGGTIFARFVVLPSHGVLSPADRETLHVEMRRRWSKIVMASIGFLLLSGFYNYFFIIQSYKPDLPKWYHMLFGIKFLLALALFMIASLLSGRTTLADKLRARAGFWMSVNILLAVLIICLSGILRTAHPAGTPALGGPKAAVAKPAE